MFSLTPVSYAAPAFSGVKIRKDKQTKDAFDEMPRMFRPTLKAEMESLRDRLDKKVDPDTDLELSVEYVKKPFPYAHILNIHLYNPLKPGSKPVQTTPFLISRGAPALIEPAIKEGFLKAETDAAGIIEAGHRQKEDEIIEELRNFENDFAVFGRDEDAKRKIAKNIIAVNDIDVLCSVITLPGLLKSAALNNPALFGKKYAVEFEFVNSGEGEEALASISLIDLEKCGTGDKNPCVLEFLAGNETDENGFAPAKAAAEKVLLKAQREFDAFIKKQI